MGGGYFRVLHTQVITLTPDNEVQQNLESIYFILIPPPPWAHVYLTRMPLTASFPCESTWPSSRSHRPHGPQVALKMNFKSHERMRSISLLWETGEDIPILDMSISLELFARCFSWLGPCAQVVTGEVSWCNTRHYKHPLFSPL